MSQPLAKPRVKKGAPIAKKDFHRATWGVGQPTAMALDDFGSLVWDAFGGPPFLVGSAATSKTFRDVDVRFIMDDAEYEQMGLGDPKSAHQSGKWRAWCRAFSALGRQMTGLPIDFQIQQMSYANLDNGPRNALGLIPLRLREANP